MLQTHPESPRLTHHLKVLQVQAVADGRPELFIPWFFHWFSLIPRIKEMPPDLVSIMFHRIGWWDFFLTGKPDQFDGKKTHGFPVKIFPRKPTQWMFAAPPFQKIAAKPRTDPVPGSSWRPCLVSSSCKKDRPDAGACHRWEQITIASGKLIKSNGKSPFLMGKSTINGHFQLLC